MEERVVLLVAPASMRKRAEYLAAFGIAQERHPDQRIVADRELWHTAREFAQRYKSWVNSHLVSNLYILTAPDGTVGRGIFDLWRYLSKHQKSKTYALVPSGIGGISSFEEVADCTLKAISKDSGRYAIPVAGVASVPK